VSPDAEACRLFFALWPSEEVRRRIEHDTRVIARRSGGRIVPARNFHITLVFVGAVPVQRLPDIAAAATTIGIEPFVIQLDRLEAWPESHVQCLTTLATPAPLTELVDRLRLNLLSQQVKLKQQVFRPHLTLVRKLSQQRPPQPIAPIEWPVDEFVLVNSEVSSRGSEYRIVERWPPLRGER
jgi:2'-5' RNA ligase